MVRVLQIGMTENLGGMETYLMAQYRQLDKDRVQYDFVFMPQQEKDEMAFADEVQAGGSIIYRIVPRHLAPIRHYLSLFQLIWQRRHEYRAVVLNACSMDYVFPMFVAKLCGVPYRIMHSHNSGNEVSRSLSRNLLVLFNRWLMRHTVTHRWACSRLAGRWMFHDLPFTVIHNAIDLEKFHYQPELRAKMRRKLGVDDKFVVGNVARFSYQKNHTFLMDIFKEVKARVPEAVLVLVGNTQSDPAIYAEVQRKVEAYGLTDSVQFLGMRQDSNALYQAFDVFVLPSHFEGLCIASIEAQGAGLVNICSSALSPETNVSGDFHTIDLQKGAERWAEAIVQHRHDVRHDGAADLRAAGYDIREEAKKVERFYAALGE